MKQKFLLIGAAIILIILVILTSLIGSFSKKTQVSTIFKEPTPYSKNILSNQLPTPTISTGQKNYFAFQNFLSILSGPTEQNTEATPSSTTKTPTVVPLTEEEIAKKNEAKAQKNYAAFNDLLGIMFGQGPSQKTSTQQQSSFYLFDKPNVTPVGTKNPVTKSQSSVPPQSLVYYPQCNGPYDNDSMPNGCNFCAAGCGPASVAMILSSYIDKKFDPPTVLDLYKQSGLTAGCQGSTIVAAQQILNQNGVKTTDILYYEDSSTEETVQDFKNYLKNGWTMYTLVKYDPKWGHFFWIVDVDNNNNVWAYDPGDGTKPVPLNESNVSPSPRYYLAIGVKK